MYKRQGFSYERVEPVEAVVDVAGEALRDLFQMTPYYWKTPREGAERLAALCLLYTSRCV